MQGFKTYKDFVKALERTDELPKNRINENEEWQKMVEIAEGSFNNTVVDSIDEHFDYDNVNESKLSNFYARYDHQISFTFADLCDASLDKSTAGVPQSIISPSLIEDMDLVQISKREKFQDWFKEIIKNNEKWNYSRGKAEHVNKDYAFKFDMGSNGISFILFYDRIDKGSQFFEDFVFNMIDNDITLREKGKLYMNVSFKASAYGKPLYKKFIQTFRDKEK